MRRPNRLQTIYQRNLLFGILGASAVSGLCVLLTAIFLPDQSGSRPAVRVMADHQMVGEADSAQSGNAQYRGTTQFVEAGGDGFLGYVGRNVRIVSDASGPVTIDASASFDSTVAGLTLESVNDDYPFSAHEKNLGGEAYGYDRYNSSDFDGLPYVMATGGRAHPSISRNVQVIRLVEPEYPWVARDAWKEGVVKLMIHIDSTGKRAPFSYRVLDNGGIHDLEFFVDGSSSDTLVVVVVEEEPQGWFFADRVVDVIFDWRFSPHITEGTPVSGFLEITYHFCLGVNCPKLELRPMLP